MSVLVIARPPKAVVAISKLQGGEIAASLLAMAHELLAMTDTVL